MDPSAALKFLPRRISREGAALLAIAFGTAIAFASGDSNGIVIFHAPRDDLFAPMLIGVALNAIAFYAHGFPAMDRLLRRGAAKAYLLALASIYVGLLASVLVAHSALAFGFDYGPPEFRFWQILAEDAALCLLVMIVSGVYRLGREGLAARAGMAAANLPAPNLVTLRLGRRSLTVRAADILFLKAAGNFVEAHRDGAMDLAYGALSSYLQTLPPDDFFQCHRSYVVNLEHVATANAERIILINGAEIPVGRRRRAELSDRLAARSRA